METPPISARSPLVIPPPIGAAPENEDFSHPWIISGIVSLLCFGVGFLLLYSTRLWANFWQWADWPFLMYCAILTPVLLGFYGYGVYRVLARILKRAAPAKPPAR